MYAPLCSTNWIFNFVMKLNEETPFANYFRVFLNKKEASNRCSSVTANETLRSDWTINELDGWLQNQVIFLSSRMYAMNLNI